MSFAGEISLGSLGGEEKGVIIKPSLKSDIKIWCPMQEIKCLILPNGNIVEKELEKWI